MNLKKNAPSILLAISLSAPLVGDKLLDAVVSVFTEDGLNQGEILPLIGLLGFVVFIIWVLQSGLKKLSSRLTRRNIVTDSTANHRQTLKAARKEMRSSLKAFKSKKGRFDSSLLSIADQVRSLDARDNVFSARKEKTASAVIALKTQHDQSVEELERRINQLHKNLNEAENILDGLEEWAQNAAETHFIPPP